MTFIFHFLVFLTVLLLSCSDDKEPLDKETHPNPVDTDVLQGVISKEAQPLPSMIKSTEGLPGLVLEEKIGEAEGPLLLTIDPASEYKGIEEKAGETLRLDKGRAIVPTHSLVKSKEEKNRDLSRFDLSEEETVPLGLGEPFSLPATPLFDKGFSGIKKETFEDGTLKRESHYLGGKKHGPYTVWYESGGMQKKGWMKDDKWHGTYQEWWPEGVLRVKGAYFEGMQNGEWRFFDTDGNALPTLYFDMGQEVTRDLKKLRSQ